MPPSTLMGTWIQAPLLKLALMLVVRGPEPSLTTTVWRRLVALQSRA